MEKSHVPGAESLNPVDAAWFRMDQVANPADTLVLLGLETRLEIAELRKVVEDRLLGHLRFRQRVVESRLGLSRPHWELDVQFDLALHVQEAATDAAGQEQIDALLAELCNERLNLAHSPWRLWLIHSLDGGSLVFVQIHHCMGDGFALLHVLFSIADAEQDQKDGRSNRPGVAKGRVAVPNGKRGAPSLFSAVSSHLAALGRLLFLPFDEPTKLSGAPRGERRIAWSNPVSVEHVKSLARARNATVNDVIVAAIAGALRRYLSNGAAQLRPIRAIVPVNLRPLSEPLELSRGNFFGVAFPELPIDAPDAESRLARVKREMDRLKRSKEPVVAIALLNAIGRAPARIGRMVDRVFSRKASAVISNVPGPREALYLAGQRIGKIVFWVAHPASLACGLSVLSYAGSLSVGVRTDAAIIADPEQIASHFDAELADWMAGELP